MMRASAQSASTINRHYCNLIKLKENGLWMMCMYSAVCSAFQFQMPVFASVDSRC